MHQHPSALQSANVQTPKSRADTLRIRIVEHRKRRPAPITKRPRSDARDVELAQRPSGTAEHLSIRQRTRRCTIVAVDDPPEACPRHLEKREEGTTRQSPARAALAVVEIGDGALGIERGERDFVTQAAALAAAFQEVHCGHLVSEELGLEKGMFGGSYLEGDGQLY